MTQIQKSPWVPLKRDSLFNFAYVSSCICQNDHVFIAGISDAREGYVTLLNLKHKTWRELPHVPESVYIISGIAILHDYLYVLASSYINQYSYRIDLSTCTRWEKMNTIDEMGRCPIVSNGNNRFQLEFLGSNQVYDPSVRDWIDFSAMKRKVHEFRVEVVAKKIYIIGGCIKKYTPLVQIYDIESRSWSTGPDLPKVLKYFSTGIYRNRWIIVTGGMEDDTNEDNMKCFLFDIYSQKWTESSILLTTSRKDHGCVVTREHLVLIGGYSGMRSESLPSIESIDISRLLPKWDSIGHYVLVRQLLDDGRASLIDEGTCATGSNDAVKNIMKILDIDSFRTVLTFLIAK